MIPSVDGFSFLVNTKGFFMIHTAQKRKEERGKRNLCLFSLVTRYSLLVTLICFVSSLSCAQTLTVLTHDSLAISEEVIAEFTKQTGVKIKFLQAGDAGEVVNRAILTKNRPLADLLYGVDNSLLSRATSEDIFIPYQSPALEKVNPRYVFDPSYSVTPIDVGYVSFNLDHAYIKEKGLEPPTDITQLTEETYKGLTAVANPTTSSPGLAFMLVTIARFGETGDYTWLHYWADLRDNDVSVAAGWNEVYYTAFSRYGGERPIVLSYATSPAAEVMFSETPIAEPPTSNLFCYQCVYEQVEAAGILKGTKNLKAAQMFIDYMLSRSFQADIAPNMFVYPVVEDIPLPEAFSFSPVPAAEQTARLESDYIELRLKEWLKQWSQVVEQGKNP
jgi:thiamine transport system substrate-binding protein